MQFTFHQVIALVAIAAGSFLMYSGIGGADILLFLIGITILVSVGIPKRKMEIDLRIKDFKFGIRSIPDNDEIPQLEDTSSDQQV